MYQAQIEDKNKLYQRLEQFATILTETSQQLAVSQETQRQFAEILADISQLQNEMKTDIQAIKSKL
ncbi:MAG: hypothetical protein ATN35_02135 [Epulopiscium sp. Nele67-Bin004]|nr:MAG: hypothetical protein ATN35_02135 [Epulopiscium sp. Nele67-Bin004]